MNKIKAKPPKGILFWIISLFVLILLWNMLSDLSGSKTKKISFSQFMDKVESNQILNAQISTNVVTGNMNPDSRMAGMKIRNVVMKASCCVAAMVEIRSPMPSPDSR